MTRMDWRILGVSIVVVEAAWALMGGLEIRDDKLARAMPMLARENQKIADFDHQEAGCRWFWAQEWGKE